MRRVLPIGAVLLSAFTGWPDLAPAGPDVSTCAALWARAVGVLETESVNKTSITATGPSVEGEDCVLRDLRVSWGRTMDFRLRALAFRGDGFARFLSDGLPPTALVLRAEGMRRVPKMSDPVMRYLIEERFALHGVDAALSLHWREETGELVLDRLFLDFPGENAIEVSALADGISLISLESLLQSEATFGLRKVSATIALHGLFEDYVLLPVGSLLLERAENPAAKVAMLKAEALAAIDAFPDAIFPAATRDALKALIQDMPHPQGKLHVEMTAEPSLGPERGLSSATLLKTDAMTHLWPLLEGVRFDIRYNRAERSR